MELNESGIIAECAAGNWQGFDRLYDAYLPKIYRYVYYRVRHKQTAEDLTATVFFKVVKNLAAFRNGESGFAAWIYSIARNVVIDHVRQAKPTADLQAAYDVSADDDIAAAADHTLKLESIRAVMHELTPLQQEVVTLRVWDELSHREIADILKISEGSSKITFSRAVNSLKQKLPLAVFLAFILNTSV